MAQKVPDHSMIGKRVGLLVYVHSNIHLQKEIQLVNSFWKSFLQGAQARNTLPIDHEGMQSFFGTKIRVQFTIAIMIYSTTVIIE